MRHPAASERLFPPSSAVRLIGRESVLMLGGGRALLMQVAHPLVAAGVRDHSSYTREPWRRLVRTLVALYSVVHGTRREAEAVAARVQAVHARVRGERRGRPYAATDPQLMAWVHATLVDTGLVMYETFVGRLSPAQREAFYADMLVVAEVFGLSREELPPDLLAFQRYLRRMLEEGELEVGEEAREVARTVLFPPVPAPLRPGFAALRLLTSELLPAELRAGYGLRSTLLGRSALAAAARTAKALLPLVPAWLRSLEPAEGRPAASAPPLRLVSALAG
jgi:uncharacterized protein (DUF2236 family)